MKVFDEGFVTVSESFSVLFAVTTWDEEEDSHMVLFLSFYFTRQRKG